MNIESWLAFGFGVAFASALFVTGLVLIFRKEDPPPFAAWLLRVIMALAAAGFGAVVPGMLGVEMNAGGVIIRATAGFGLFVLVYLVTPKPPGDRGPTQNVIGNRAKGVQVTGNNNSTHVS